MQWRLYGKVLQILRKMAPLWLFLVGFIGLFLIKIKEPHDPKYQGSYARIGYLLMFAAALGFALLTVFRVVDLLRQIRRSKTGKRPIE